MATLQGKPVDRPAVSFYGVGGRVVDPDDPDEFNVYNGPSWRPLLALARERSDLIVSRSAELSPSADNPRGHFFKTESYRQGRSKFTRTTLTVAGRTMTSLTRRDPEVDTIWDLEHLLKDGDDIKAFLQLPAEAFNYDVDVAKAMAQEQKLGEDGIIMLGCGDPLCAAGRLFSMEDFTIIATTEQALFHQLLEKFSPSICEQVEQAARLMPGRLWQVVGSEFASEPYLPPKLYREYEVRYTKPIIEAINRHGGYARIHSHGRLRNILPLMLEMPIAALDPIEPPPLGDMTLLEARQQYGRDLVLFGNIEIRDVEFMPPAEFEKVVAQALREGTAGAGRGFVLLPSSSPYGREITPTAMANYETMVRLTQAFAG